MERKAFWLSAHYTFSRLITGSFLAAVFITGIMATVSDGVPWVAVLNMAALWALGMLNSALSIKSFTTLCRIIANKQIEASQEEVRSAQVMLTWLEQGDYILRANGTIDYRIRNKKANKNEKHNET